MSTIACAVFNILKISKKYDKDVTRATNILDSMMKANFPLKSKNSEILVIFHKEFQELF
tara:strand:+ start:1394 stop:1570 length:177 start_codon:yes stop_codon:yes gene_type:complete